MRRIHRNTVLASFLFVVLASTALWAEERVTLISDTFSRTGDLTGSNPEFVAPELGTLTWQKPTGTNVGKDTTNGSQVTTGSGTASVLSAEALYGKTLVISSDIMINTTSGASGTAVGRGLGLGFFGTLDTPTGNYYNRYGFSGVIIYPGTSPAAGTVYYGTYNKSSNQLSVTTGSAISDYSNTTAYNLSYKIALSRDGQSAVISDIKVGDTAMFPEGTTFTVATNATNATGTNYLGIISSSGATGTSGKVDNFKVEQSYGTVTSGNETKFNANTAFDIKVTSGTTLNVAEYLNAQDINPASGEFYLAGKGWNNTGRQYLDNEDHPTNYTQIDEGAIVVGGLGSDRSIYPNIVIDATEGATISKVGWDTSLTGKLILKGNLTGGTLTTFGIRQSSTTVLDGNVNLSGLDVATGTLQFNSTSSVINSKTVYLTNGINVEKGAVLALNRYSNFEIRTSTAEDAPLGTITLNDSTLKGMVQSGDWNLKANLTVNGDSTINYGGVSHAIKLQGGTLHGGTNATLQNTNLWGGGFVLQNNSELTGTLEFKGTYKLKFESGSTMKGNLTVSGGTLHFAETGSATRMTADSSITMTGGTLQIDNGKLQGTVLIQGGTLASNLDFQTGTLTFDGASASNNSKNITMSGGTLVLQNSANLSGGTINLNGGNIEGNGKGSSIGTVTLSKDSIISQTNAEYPTFYVTNLTGANNKLTYKPSSVSVLEFRSLDVKELNYDCNGARGVVNIKESAVLGSGGLTKTGSGTADFHVYDGAVVSMASGLENSQIASGINTRLVGSTEFDIGQGQTLTINSPVVSTSTSTTQQLHKTGAGTLVLNGANTFNTTTEGEIYSTFVDAGTLVVNGSLADGVLVGSNGTLATGTATTPGTLTITGPLNVFGTVSLDLFDAGSDTISATEGILFQDGSNLEVNLMGLSDADTRDYIPILGLSAFTSEIPLENLVSVTGSVTNWTPVLLEGTLTLTRPSEVPEPAAWVLLLLGLIGLKSLKRRK